MEYPVTEQQAAQYSPLALAFLGDAVFGRYVRERLLTDANMPAGKLHGLSVRYVCAEFQAAAIEWLSGELTQTEADLYRRGRNTGGNHVPKHSTVAEYRAATGLETLFGYLALSGQETRARTLFELIWSEKEAFLSAKNKTHA